MLNIYEQVDRNKTKSIIIVIGFIAFIVTAIYIIMSAFGADTSIIYTAIIFATLGSIGSYYFSDRIVLSLSNAHPASREEYFDFYTVTENLTMAAQMPMPKLYVIDDSAMNAFATGRDPQHAVVVATTGIINRLNRTELEGVIAHELSHIRNYDIRLMAVVAVLVGSLTLLADMLLRWSWFGGRRRNNEEGGSVSAVISILGIVLVMLSPFIANMIKLAISRRREFLADASGALLTKYPEGLASALEKIAQDNEPLEAANKATAHLYIANPLKNRHDSVGWFASLFSTHPPVEERIAALRNME